MNYESSEVTPARHAPKKKKKPKKKQLKNKQVRTFLAQTIITIEVFAKTEQEAQRFLPDLEDDLDGFSAEIGGWTLTEVPQD